MIKEFKEHRSCRNFQHKAVSQTIIDEIVSAAVRASNTGNMQLYSIIVTTDKSLLERLSPLHFNQPAITTAPLVMTFCADIHRFSKWCVLRGAKPAYDNFLWFINAATDALLASQNAATEAEAQGLGICYLGTTIYNADGIAEVLELPNGVAPVATVVMGYPAAQQPLTPRLPLNGIVHQQTYCDYSNEDIERIWQERECSDETAKLLEENGLPNLAQIFTERRYKGEDNLTFSRSYFEFLRKKGFFNQ